MNDIKIECETCINFGKCDSHYSDTCLITFRNNDRFIHPNYPHLKTVYNYEYVHWQPKVKIIFCDTCKNNDICDTEYWVRDCLIRIPSKEYKNFKHLNYPDYKIIHEFKYILWEPKYSSILLTDKDFEI